MVSQTAIAVTALLQMWGKSIFVSQQMGECSPAPAVGGTIFLVATLLLIWECNILPKVFQQRAPWFFAAAEILITVFVTELIIQLGWCTYERMTHRMVQVICCHKMWCEFGLMTSTTIVGAFAALCVVVEVVCPDRIKESVSQLLDILPVPDSAAILINSFQDMHTYLMGAIYFSQLTREQRRLAVQAFELQVKNSKIPQDKTSNEPQKKNLENPSQDSMEMKEDLDLDQSAELLENLDKKTQKLEDLQDLLDLQTDESQLNQEPNSESEMLEESNA